MNVVPTELEGVLVIEPQVYRDQRGFFLETYRKEAYRQCGVVDEFVQDNRSHSRRGVLRGLHYQDMSAPMAKLIRCSAGHIYDVAVDLRLGSPQFGRWVGVELTSENMRQLYIPVGFAHGFVTLSETADLDYKCGGYYTPSAEQSVAWNDSELAIAWPISEPILSDRDRKAMTLKDYRSRPAFHYAASLP